MIFSTPVKFDENEWFVIIGFVVLMIVFLFNRKHFSPALIFIILLFTSTVGITTDYILATEFPFNYYDAMDTKKYDWFDFLMSNINYGLYGYLFMHFYDKWQLRGMKRFALLIYWWAQSLVLEFVAVKLHVFKYNDWSIGKSAIAYVLIFMSYLVFLKIVKQAMRQFRASEV